MNRENLIPARKGEIRNPAGKPKGTKNRSTIVRQWLETELMTENLLTGKQQVLSVTEIVVMMQAKAALEGNLKACEWLFDSAFGKLTEKTELAVQIPADEAILKGRHRIGK